MNEPKNMFNEADNRFVVHLTVELRQLIRDEITNNGGSNPDAAQKLLTPTEAATLLGGDVEKQIRWLYRHSKQLPFARQLSRKNMRFSEAMPDATDIFGNKLFVCWSCAKSA